MVIHQTLTHCLLSSGMVLGAGCWVLGSWLLASGSLESEKSYSQINSQLLCSARNKNQVSIGAGEVLGVKQGWGLWLGWVRTKGLSGKPSACTDAGKHGKGGILM